MKRLTTLVATLLLTTAVMAGGLMTNTNQSAAYVRLLARNASLGIDGVYFNPAGLTKLNNGFSFSLNNQFIFQRETILNNYPYLNGAPSATYYGDVEAPVFPDLYMVYKKNKFAFSFGFSPVGGGGGATYDKGLPSFEMPVSDLVPMLNKAAGVTAYKSNIYFEGSSIFMGYQLGISYEINPVVSIFGGVRYVTAKNTYKGSISDIMINPSIAGTPYNGSFMRADLFGQQMSAYYTGVATKLTAAATSLQPIITAGAGNLTLAQLVGAGQMTAAQQAQLEGGLAQLGLTSAQISAMNVGQIQGAYTAGATQATGGSAQMGALAAKTGDKSVDASRSGSGYTPVIGANFTFAEKITLALKYEFKTKLELTNKTAKDDTGMFPDGVKVRSDMPAMLAVGLASPLGSKFTGHFSMNYYFDKSADYGKADELGASIANKDIIKNNYYELAAGLEYKINDGITASAGYQYSKPGVTKNYLSDMDISLASNSVGLGAQFKVSPKVDLNAGFLRTFYKSTSKDFTHMLGATAVPVTETYSKKTFLVSFGIDVKLGN